MDNRKSEIYRPPPRSTRNAAGRMVVTNSRGASFQPQASRSGFIQPRRNEASLLADRFARSVSTRSVVSSSTSHVRSRDHYANKKPCPEWALSGNNDGDKHYRKAHRPLKPNEDLDFKPGSLSNTGKKLLQLVESVYRPFIIRDRIFDHLKANNASNLERLKTKHEEEQQEGTPAEFDSQIRSCLANKNEMHTTWQMLISLFGEQILKDYIKQSGYTEEELDPMVITRRSLLDVLNDDKRNAGGRAKRGD